MTNPAGARSATRSAAHGGARRAGRRLAALAMVAGALASGACSLLDDLDGLTGTELEAGTATSGDAESDLDASAEQPDVAPPIECDATFCDDFDTATFAERWSNQWLSTNGASVSRVDAGRSPPFALRAAVPPLAAGEHRRAMLTRPFTAPRGMDCTFYVRGSIENPTTIYTLRVTSADFATYELEVTLYPNDAGANVALMSARTFDGGVDAGYAFGGTGSLAIGDWNRLTVRAAFGDGDERPPLFAVLIGDSPPSREIATTTSTVERIELFIGADSFGRAAGEILVDDVRCAARD